ncbi:MULTISPECIES: hypothetical protein [Streptomyces]|uniref:Uncharacterized protein n=1 Tax=Streptomyces parvus TaxID=66428 RepID=A0A5D4IEU7_9ACTN|nr:hypothetical protein [Streptomyces parvus]TYR50705.1 hypothetical protein FY004_32220 [Streptomyces parvus]GGW04312.1 hypothetical protein GCM10010264_20920 [Streptomyces globisporus]
MAADEENTPPAHQTVPLAPLPDHRNVHTSWWQELWRRHAHITTPLRQRGLSCDIEFGLSAYIVRVPLLDDSYLIIGPPQEPVSDRPPGDPEGWIATREHPIDQSVFEVVYDSSPADDPGAPQRPETRHGGSAEPLIAAIDHRLAQLGLLPSPELHTFEVTQDATVSFTLQARDLADAHERVADLESTEAATDTALDGGTRLTHITYGSVHDTTITAEGNSGTTTVSTACSDALLKLTDQINGSTSHVQAAALLRQILDPDDGVLARLADSLEAAADKAKEAEEDDGFDLSHDLADAAAEVRSIGENLQTAEARMRTLISLAPSPRPQLSPSRTPSLPPRPLPTAPPRHTR